MEHDGDGHTNCNRNVQNDLLMFGKGPGRVRKLRTIKDHPHNIIEIRQNPEKSSGNLRKFVVSQTQGKGNQLTLEEKKKLAWNYNNDYNIKLFK